VRGDVDHVNAMLVLELSQTIVTVKEVKLSLMEKQTRDTDGGREQESEREKEKIEREKMRSGSSMARKWRR